MTFPFDRFMSDWRAVRHKDGTKITQAELDLIRMAIDGQYQPAAPALSSSPKASEPRWLQLAREKIGEREIKGPKHSSWIAGAWGRLGATWFNDDETPWCGLFVADCLAGAGRKILGAAEFPRALAWAKWGVPCPPTVGAVVVFKRTGGGHVGFLVGESEANYYVLGGNQGDMVSIAPIAKARAVAIRWPHDVGRPAPGLPRMTGGVVSTNEG